MRMFAGSPFTPGKIILSGEYAVATDFGRGIALPSSFGITAAFEKGGTEDTVIVYEDRDLSRESWGLSLEAWRSHRETAIATSKTQASGLKPHHRFIKSIITACHATGTNIRGHLSITSDLPPGRGMGSSTALVIAIARALLGESCKEAALQIEDAVNPGGSGIDFAVIWENRPVLFERGKPLQTPQELDPAFLQRCTLIDTGAPGEPTPELVAWVKAKLESSGERQDAEEALRAIGQCTERLFRREDPLSVFRAHHCAQVALGVVPLPVQELIAEIEEMGGAAKVTGAGARTGGGGMVLANGIPWRALTGIAKKHRYALYAGHRPVGAEHCPDKILGESE